MNPRQVEQHIVILGWLYVAGHALFLVVGAFVFLLLTGIGLATADMEARAVLVVVGPTVGLLLAILALPGIAADFGLLYHKPWARILAIVVGILGLVNFPLGTAIGLYACWVLLPTSSQGWFAPRPAARA